jgi:hypothetical protein
MSLRLDVYIFDTLMPDLVGHDKQPSAFIVFLHLWARARTRRAGPHGPAGRWTSASLQQIALDSGLSKSAVQQAVRTLKRRRLVDTYQRSATAVPEYLVHAPWRRSKPTPAAAGGTAGRTWPETSDGRRTALR